jgi:hypothetical protein
MATLSRCRSFLNVVAMPDRPLSSEAQALLRHATVADLKADAHELVALMQAAERPIPVLPLDPAEREAVLMLLLLQARDRSRRLRTLLGDVRS